MEMLLGSSYEGMLTRYSLAFLMIVAWMLLAGNWAILPGVWQWAVGRFVPTLILVMMLIDLGAFVGTQGENKYGKDTQELKDKADNKSSS